MILLRPLMFSPAIHCGKWIAIKCIMLVLLGGCLPPAQLGTLNHVSFRTVNNIPVVVGKINGKKAFFVIDTGASVSIIDESCSKRFGFRITSTSDQRVVGLGGRSRLNKTMNCLVEVGTLKIDQITFRTKSLKHFIAAVRKHENIEVAGIIGADVFDRYRLTINYKNRTISF